MSEHLPHESANKFFYHYNTLFGKIQGVITITTTSHFNQILEFYQKVLNISLLTYFTLFSHCSVCLQLYCYILWHT